MRHGYTLVEMTLALAVSGLALGIALPRFGALRDGLEVERAVYEVVAAHRRARLAAVLRGRPVVLTVGPDSLACHLSGAATRLWRAAGPARHGVGLLTPERQVTFSPVGITTGVANASYRLTRGAASRTVVVSRLGRARVTRP